MAESPDAPHQMRPRPTTPEGVFGRWAAGLGAATLVSFVALVVLGYLDVRFAPLIVAMFLSGIATLVTAALSLLLERDRTIVTWAALVVGALATLLLVAEFTIME